MIDMVNINFIIDFLVVFFLVLNIWVVTDVYFPVELYRSNKKKGYYSKGFFRNVPRSVSLINVIAIIILIIAVLSNS